MADVRLVRSSTTRHLYQIPGGYEVIHVGRSAVSVRTLVRDLGREDSKHHQFGDPMWLPREGVLRVANAIERTKT